MKCLLKEPSKLKYISTLFALLLTVGCEVELDIKLFTQDIIDTANGTGTYKTPVNVHLEIPSKGWLKKDKNERQVRTFLEKRFGKSGDFTTFERDFSTFLVAPVKIPLNLEKSASENIFELLVSKKSDKSIDVFFKVNKKKFEDFSRDIKDEFFDDLNPEDVVVNLDLNNDTRGPLTIKGYSVYLNNKPFPFEGSKTLDRRDSIKVKISKVHMGYLGVNGESKIITIHGSN